MLQLLFRSRSIATAVLWGLLSGIATFLAMLVMEFAYAIYSESFGSPHRLSAISLGNGYSIDLEATPAHPFLAEYKQEVVVYKNGARSGGLIGRVKIAMNTGGRVRIFLLVPIDSSKKIVAFSDRHDTSVVDLERLEVQELSNALISSDWMPIGVLSAESPPLKFIPCALWPRLVAEERNSIVREEQNASTACAANGR